MMSTTFFLRFCGSLRFPIAVHIEGDPFVRSPLLLDRRSPFQSVGSTSVFLGITQAAFAHEETATFPVEFSDNKSNFANLFSYTEDKFGALNKETVSSVCYQKELGNGGFSNVYSVVPSTTANDDLHYYAMAAERLRSKSEARGRPSWHLNCGRYSYKVGIFW